MNPSTSVALVTCTLALVPCQTWNGAWPGLEDAVRNPGASFIFAQSSPGHPTRKPRPDVTRALTQAAAEVVINRPVPSMHTGRNFKAALSNALTASWRNVNVRTILRGVSEDRKIAILLDRRIDPTQELVVDINDLSVQEAIERIAKQVSAKVSVVGNSLYVGPSHGTPKLRTLIELRSQELLDVSSLPKGRRFELVNRRTMHWNDLDRPVDLIGRIADRYKLKVEGLDGIGHDLWAGSTLPNVNAAEALSLVLI